MSGLERWAGGVVLALAGAGSVLVLLGTFLPYVRYSGGDSYAVFDVDHLGTTWPGALSYLVAVVAIPFVAYVSRGRPWRLGAFLTGLGLVVFLDFLGAFVIGPTTYAGSADLKTGGVLGTVGGGLLVVSGVVALTRREGDELAYQPPGSLVASQLAATRKVRLAVLAAVGASAVLGIVAIVLGDFADPGDIEVKALGSSLTVTIGLLVVLGCVPALQRGRLTPLPLLGVGVSAIGFGTLFAGVWGQWSSGQYWKITGTLVIAALACAWASLLALARLQPLHPLRITALLSVLAFGVVSVAAIWALTSSGTFWRTFGTLGLTLLATTASAIVASGSQPKATELATPGC